MERKFQCKDCGVMFDSNDLTMVNCPSCGSDNVVPSKPKSKMPKYIAIGILAVILAFGIGLLVKTLRGTAEVKEDDIDDIVEDTALIVEEDISEMPNDIVVGLAPLQLVKKVTGDSKTKTYSFTVAPSNTIDGNTYKYQLIDFATGKMVKEQAAGVFTGIAPASDADGSYIVKAFAYDAKGAQVEDATLTIIGCVKFPEGNIKKRTVAEVQADINHMIKSQSTKNITSSWTYSKNVRFTCSDGEKINSFGEILEQINLGLWSSVKVGSVGYDSENRVNAITLNVN